MLATKNIRAEQRFPESDKFRLATERFHVIEPTPNTPFIRFDGSKGELIVKGDSVRLEIIDFYIPILNMVDEYLFLEEKLVCHFHFNRFNTSTAKILYNMMRHFNKVQRKGKKIKIYWFYESSAYEMEETGADYMELFDLDFELIPL